MDGTTNIPNIYIVETSVVCDMDNIVDGSENPTNEITNPVNIVSEINVCEIDVGEIGEVEQMVRSTGSVDMLNQVDRIDLVDKIIDPLDETDDKAGQTNNFIISPAGEKTDCVKSGYQHTPFISIVMAYHNRIEQLKVTLESISASKYSNFEVIIVDDASDDFHSVSKIINSYDYEIKVLSITKEQKKWINPCIAYNFGFMLAKGDIIIIQNPEIVHIGDVLTYTANNIKDGMYIVYSVFSSPSFTHNRYFYSMNSFDGEYIKKNFIDKIDHNKFKFDYTFYRNNYEDTKKMSGRNALRHWMTIGKNEGRQCNESGIYFVDGAIKTKGWYNHPQHNNRALNLLLKKLI